MQYSVEPITAVERLILEDLIVGDSLPTIAKRRGDSESTMYRRMEALRERYKAKSLPHLVAVLFRLGQLK